MQPEVVGRTADVSAVPKAVPGAANRAVAAISLVALVASSASLHAATREVCGLCTYSSIQLAIDAAAPGDLIRILDPTHTEAEIVVDEDVTIEGLGVNATLVQASVTLAEGNGRVFDIADGVSATLRKMTIRHGYELGTGGGVRHDGVELRLEDVRITDNRAYEGGGVYVGTGSKLLLRRCEVVQNAAFDATFGSSQPLSGGGIWSGGVLHVTESLIAGNMATLSTGVGTSVLSGGGIHSVGTLVLVASAVEENSVNGGGSATGFGGGIRAAGWSYIDRTRIEGNSVEGYGGGIYVDGSLVLTGSTVSDNGASRNGGGLYLVGTGEIDVIRSAIHDNAAADSGGGILAEASDAELANVTLSGNLARLNGGGISLSTTATVRLANVTVAFNHADADSNDSGNGGGLYVASDSSNSGTVAMRNTLIANNTADTSPFYRSPDCAGALGSDGYNIVGSLGMEGLGGTACTLSSSNGLQTGIVVALDPLALYGGLTPSHRLPPGSPAQNEGNPSGCLDYDGAALDVDQRLAERNGICDVGAYERGGTPGVFFDGFESGTPLSWTSSSP